MAFKMKYSGGTPFHFHGGDPAEHDKKDPKETKFVDTPEGRIAVERQTMIEGRPVERIAQPGTPEYDKWKAAVDKDPTIEDIQNIFRRAYDFNKDDEIARKGIKREFDLYLTQAGYKRNPKVETNTNVGDWRETS
mgnify:CR=1 FL=1